MQKFAKSDSEYLDLMKELWGGAPAADPPKPAAPTKDWRKLLQELDVRTPTPVSRPTNKPIAVSKSVSSKVPGFTRVTKITDKTLQRELGQISTKILNMNNIIGTQTPFQHRGVSYMAVVEPHAPSARNPTTHPGVSLMVKTNQGGAAGRVEPAAKFVKMTERALSKVNPKLKTLAEQFINIAAQQGIGVIVTQGFRSLQEQEKLYQQGRTTKGPVVTNAKPGSSNHNFGRAFDVALVDKNGGPTWKSDTPGVWDRLGQIGESLGLKWGGRWKGFTDRPHFELPAAKKK